MSCFESAGYLSDKCHVMNARIIVRIIGTNNIKNKVKMTEKNIRCLEIVKRPKLLLAQVL